MNQEYAITGLMDKIWSYGTKHDRELVKDFLHQLINSLFLGTK